MPNRYMREGKSDHEFDFKKIHKIKVPFLHFEGAIKYIGGVIISQKKFNYEIRRKTRIYKLLIKRKFRFSFSVGQ